MRSHRHLAKFGLRGLALSAAALAAGLWAGLAPSAAQAQTKEVDSEGGVLVVGKPVGRSPTTGAPIQWVSYSIIVHTNDLDLRTDRGVNILERRINRASRTACAHLDMLHPITAVDSPPCFKPTYDQGMQDAGVIVAAARKAG